jgi:hypothetical protein
MNRFAGVRRPTVRDLTRLAWLGGTLLVAVCAFSGCGNVSTMAADGAVPGASGSYGSGGKLGAGGVLGSGGAGSGGTVGTGGAPGSGGVYHADVAWKVFDVLAGSASIVGLLVSLYVALRLNTFRTEVRLRIALDDLHGQLGGTEKNLKLARSDSRHTGPELSRLKAHLTEIEAKFSEGAVRTRARALTALIDKAGDSAIDEIISSLAGLRAAMAHFRRDQRWTL